MAATQGDRHEPGTLKARVDAMSAMPRPYFTNDVPHLGEPARAHLGSARPSAVRAVLAQAALHMHLPEQRYPVASNGGPETERLKATLRQLKADAKEGLGAVGAQLAMESESARVVEHVNAQVRAVQRAFGVLADTLEDEVGNLRAADAQQWEQLKVHASQFNEIESLKRELDRTKYELRTHVSAFSAFRTDEHAALSRKLDDAHAEITEQREQIDAMHKAHTAERSRLVEEVGALRRWRNDIAAPFIEAAGRSVASHEQQLERALPHLQKSVEELDGR